MHISRALIKNKVYIVLFVFIRPNDWVFWEQIYSISENEKTENIWGLYQEI